MIGATEKTPQFTAKDLQDDLMKGGMQSSCNAEYKKNTKQAWVHSGTPLLIKKNIKGRLEYAKINLDRPVEFQKDVLWSDVTKPELHRSAVCLVQKG